MNDHRIKLLAISALVSQRDAINAELKELQESLNEPETPTLNFEHKPKPKRTMSAAARRRISIGMKRRYAALRAAAKKRHGR